MSPDEIRWVQKRRQVATTSLREFLVRINITGFDAGSYVDQHADNLSDLPNIGLAFSGGGWRALMNGAGALKAFDSRTLNSTAEGHIGGLLQSATYIAGLSGGGWLVGSIYTNNFTSVAAAIEDTSGSLWKFGDNLLEGPATGGVQLFRTIEYWDNIIHDVRGKRKAGFDVSITDLWARALSYQLINATTGGEFFTFSSIAGTQGFQDATQPFPMIVAEGRSPGDKIVSFNSTMYEFNPFEMGSWDADVYGFFPTQYLGTNMTAGNVTNGHQCVVGFDNCAFIMGTSSTLFNQFLLQIGSVHLPSLVKDVVIDILEDLSKDDDDIANYSPNPFYGWNNSTNPTAHSHQLTLVDGGEDYQTIPFYPLIQPVRKLDVVFAVDSSDDTPNTWPNGTSLVTTFERSQGAIANGTGFPYIPDTNTFINLGLNNRPTFFGCNSSNVTHPGNVPLVVYLPNSPYTTHSNLDTFQLATSDRQRDAMILNGYNIATMGNSTVDSTWSVCVACAILSRSFERTNTTVPSACSTCFTKFCWDGTLNATKPRTYAPTPILVQGRLLDDSASTTSPTVIVGIIVSVVIAVALIIAIILRLRISKTNHTLKSLEYQLVNRGSRYTKLNDR